MATKLEEVIAAANAPELQRLAPHFGDEFFSECAGRFEIFFHFRPVISGIRQRLPIEFSIGHEWKSINDYECRGQRVWGKLSFKPAS